MTYELGFVGPALKEWETLDRTIRDQFRAKLAERLTAPQVLSSKLSGSKDRHKIKLRSAGYRLVYEIRDQRLVVVVAVGKRDRSAVHRAAAAR